MYRIKIPYCQIPLKRIFLLLVYCLLKTGVTAQTTTYHKAESFLFSFKENSDMFLADYGDNAYQLERMGRLLDASRNRLLKGNSHLLIVSHVDAYTGGFNLQIAWATAYAAGTSCGKKNESVL